MMYNIIIKIEKVVRISMGMQSGSNPGPWGTRRHPSKGVRFPLLRKLDKSPNHVILIK